MCKSQNQIMSFKRTSSSSMESEDEEAPAADKPKTYDSKKLPYTKFSQQELPTIKPLMTPKWIVSMFLLLGFTYIPIGVVILIISNSMIEISFNYGAACIMNYSSPSNPLNTNNEMYNFMQNVNNPKTCNVSINVPKYMKNPVYVYYQLENFFQNHRRYSKSRSDKQLCGTSLKIGDLDVCKPQDSINNVEIVPCGMIAWSLFNDTFDFSTSNGPIVVDRGGISWLSDREEIFSSFVFPSNFPNNNVYGNSSQFIGGGKLNPNVSLNANEDFIVWMRTASSPKFRKLWGKIDNDINPGLVFVNITNQYNVYNFGGAKKLVLSTRSWIGGKNAFLGCAYVVVGALCVVIGFTFAMVHWRNPRPLGAIAYLSWTRKFEDSDN